MPVKKVHPRTLLQTSVAESLEGEPLALHFSSQVSQITLLQKKKKSDHPLNRHIHSWVDFIAFKQVSDSLVDLLK